MKDPMGNARMGASATTTINRRDFGVSGYPAAMIADDVAVTIDVELVKATSASHGSVPHASAGASRCPLMAASGRRWARSRAMFANASGGGATPGVASNCLQGGLGIVHYGAQAVVVGRRQRSMPSLGKDRLAAEAMECWADFQHGLPSDSRKYPIQQFKAFWAVTKRYAELTRSDPVIHRSVTETVNGLPIFSKWSVSAFPKAHSPDGR
jgi:hypothetical protein